MHVACQVVSSSLHRRLYKQEQYSIKTELLNPIPCVSSFSGFILSKLVHFNCALNKLVLELKVKSVFGIAFVFVVEILKKLFHEKHFNYNSKYFLKCLVKTVVEFEVNEK